MSPLLAFANIVPSVFNVIIQGSWQRLNGKKTWGEEGRGVIGFHKLSKAGKGRNTSGTQPWIECGLSPTALELCFWLLVGCVLFFFFTATLFLPCGLGCGCQQCIAWPFPRFTIRELKTRFFSFQFRKSLRKMMIGPSHMTSHLDQSLWPQEQDHLRRWQFPVRAPHGGLGEKGYALQEGGCSAHWKPRRQTFPPIRSISLRCPPLLGNPVFFPTSGALEAFLRLPLPPAQIF